MGYIIRFYIVFIANFASNVSINYIVYQITEFKIIAFLIATFFGMSVNYIGQRFFVFHPNNKTLK